MIPLLSMPSKKMGEISDWTNGTVDRILDIIEEGQTSKWYRGGIRYRDHIPESKF
jgi:hypothetical protein